MPCWNFDGTKSDGTKSKNVSNFQKRLQFSSVNTVIEERNYGMEPKNGLRKRFSYFERFGYIFE